jgi:hypothetical protein
MKVYSANAEGTIYISCNIEYNALAVYSIQKCQTTVLFKYWNYICFYAKRRNKKTVLSKY